MLKLFKTLKIHVHFIICKLDPSISLKKIYKLPVSMGKNAQCH